MDVFICHTYYHILIAVVEKLTIYQNVEMDLALSYVSTNLNGIENNPVLQKLFHSVYVITEKLKPDMEQQEGKTYSAKTRIGRILQRGFETKKFGKYVGKYLENDFRSYDNIRLFCDPDPIGYYFYTQGIKYYAIEDALDSYQNDIMAGWRNQFWLKKLLNRMGMQFIPHGYSWNCLGVEVNDATNVCASTKNLIVVNRKSLFSKLDKQAQGIIKDIFANDFDNVNDTEIKHLFLTQPLFPTYFHSIEDQIYYYRKILSETVKCEETLYIKPHPRDLTDYQTYFPDAIILNRDYPVEVLNLIPNVRFKSAITAFSTSIKALDSVEEKHFVGYPIFLEYIRGLYASEKG